jgi:sigma-B regulation protein RsbQ
MPISPSLAGLSLHRNNVNISGNPLGQPMLFSHGFGGTQESWRFVTPEFLEKYLVIVFDHVGCGGSDASAYDRGKYDSLHGYADDILEFLTELGLRDVIYVGHCVGSMMGVLAANRVPELFRTLILIGPSPKYVDDDDYVGGFSQEAITALLDSLDSNYLGWSSAMAPGVVGNAELPELGEDLAASIWTVDPTIAAQFARVTFLSDNRRDLADVVVPTLVLQSSDDVIAPLAVGEYVYEHIAGSTLVVMDSRGHVPNLSDPAEVVKHIRSFIE